MYVSALGRSITAQDQGRDHAGRHRLSAAPTGPDTTRRHERSDDHVEPETRKRRHHIAELTPQAFRLRRKAAGDRPAAFFVLSSGSRTARRTSADALWRRVDTSL